METKDILKIVVACAILITVGFEIGFLSHPLIQTTIDINSGNYSFEIGTLLHEILNKSSYYNSTTYTTSQFGNTTSFIISHR